MAVLLLAATATITTEVLPTGLLPQMADNFQVNHHRIGLFVSIFAATVMVSTLPLIALTNRRPRRRLFMAVMAAFAAGNALLAVAPSYEVALVARVVVGLGHGVLWAGMAAYITAIVPPERAGRAVAFVFSGNSLALTVGVPAFTALGDAVGWRVSFAALALMAAAIMAAAPVALPEVPGTPANGPSGISDALRQPVLLAIAATTAIVMGGHFALHTYLVPVLMAYGFPAAGSSLALAVFGGAGIAGAWAAGVLVDRRVPLGLPASVGLLVVAMAGIAATAAWPGGLLVAIALWGATYAALPIMLQSTVMSALPAMKTSASAVFLLAFNLGISAGSWTGGAVVGAVGSHALPVVAALLAAPAAAVALLCTRQPRHPAGAVATASAEQGASV